MSYICVQICDKLADHELSTWNIFAQKKYT